MGSFYSYLFPTTNYKIIMFGLDAAGKTSIIRFLKNRIGDKSNTPYDPYFTPKLNYKGLLSIIKIDIGCCDGPRGAWGTTREKMNQAFKNAKGIIFVIDSHDNDRLDEDFMDDFNYILCHEDLKNLPVLIMANKQDLDSALSLEEIIKKIEIEKFKDKIWLALGTSIITGEGIEEGLDWMISILNKSNIK